MWKLRISVNGEPPFWVETHLAEYMDAESYCKRLYGNTFIVVDQEFVNN